MQTRIKPHTFGKLTPECHVFIEILEMQVDDNDKKTTSTAVFYGKVIRELDTKSPRAIYPFHSDSGQLSTTSK